MKKFKVGDKVSKPKGYSFDGTVVSVFQNGKGETRLVVELDYNGMLHIFSENQLELHHNNDYTQIINIFGEVVYTTSEGCSSKSELFNKAIQEKISLKNVDISDVDLNLYVKIEESNKFDCLVGAITWGKIIKEVYYKGESFGSGYINYIFHKFTL
ncbi:MAG: hypothetical protein LBM02_09810 [Lachnospiraceae bacterium]|jgi:hypothetical protein|nr:hypothetical protein [Lachnospiraceae bacterium]